MRRFDYNLPFSLNVTFLKQLYAEIKAPNFRNCGLAVAYFFNQEYKLTHNFYVYNFKKCEIAFVLVYKQ